MIFEITIFAIFAVLLLYFITYKYLATNSGVKILPAEFISWLDHVALWLLNFVLKIYKQARSAAGREARALPGKVARGAHALWRKISHKIDNFFDRIRRNYR